MMQVIKQKVIEYADKIDISSQHLLGIINDVLDMSKIEAGKTVFKYSDFSILDFIQELDTIFHTQIYEKQQTLTIIKRKHPARVGERRSGSSDADFSATWFSKCSEVHAGRWKKFSFW